jgi:hypothetical protein
MQHEFNACEKENRSLNNLIVQIGEAVIRHVKKQEVERNIFSVGFASSVRASVRPLTVFTGRFLLGLWRLDSGVRGPHFRRRLRCLRHLDGVAFDALNSATRF